MAHQIIERPAAFCMTKNEIRYVYKVTDLTRVGLYLEMQLWYCRTDQAVYTSLPSFKLVPNTDGTVYLSLQLYIDSFLQWAFPKPTDNMFAAQTQSCSFYIVTREIDDTTITTPIWNTSEYDNLRIALKMGIEKNRYSRNNLLTYLLNNNSFFSWQTNNKLIFYNQPNYLTFLLPTGNSNGYQLKVVFQTIQGTNDDIISPFANYAAFLFHIKTDPTTLGITVPDGEQLHWYEVSILDNNNIVVVGTYRYYIDYDTYYHYHDFIYINSLGGIDTARARGEIEYSFERAVDEIEGGFNLNNSVSTIKQAETIYRAINIKRTFKGDLGFRRSKPEQDSMIELLASTAIYELLDGNLIPLLQIQKTHSLRKTTDMLLPFAIEWQHAESNEVYTPSKVEIGAAVDTETYYGQVFIVINSTSAEVIAITGITGYAPTLSLLMHGNSPNMGKHTTAITVSSIAITALLNSIAATATLKQNDTVLEIISLIENTPVPFTGTEVIGINDLIEIIIN